jgi:ribosomal protein S18 acetylase RimI-like enzyme
MSDVTIREATRADLPQIYEIWYRAETAEMPDPPAPRPVAAWLTHVLEHGRLLAAERGGAPVGFAGLVVRDGVAFLTDLFVQPDQQSGGIGGKLLGHILPPGARARCTTASSDPRALALYLRAGMQPRWPNCWLRGFRERLSELPGADVEVMEAAPEDPALLAWDAEIGGRRRPEDHAFWVERMAATPLWFRRGGQRIGYGYVQGRSDESLRYPQAAALGPIGARTPEDAVACVGAAARWASGRSEVMRIALPGPHPALAPLLAARFQLIDVETYCSSAEISFYDPRLYATSGAVL